MGSQNDAATAAAAKIALLVGGVILVAALIVLVFYLLSLQKALNRCSPENRAMAPGMVWLMLIPLFGLVWHFFIVINMAKSLGAEFQKRGVPVEPEPGKKIGMIMCILGCCGIIPLIGGLFALGYLVCWIMYWNKIAALSKQLA